MNSRLNILLSIFFGIFCCFFVNAQEQPKYEALDQQFLSYEIISADASAICQQLRTPNRDLITVFRVNENTEWRLRLENSGIISPEYTVTVATENGLERSKGTRALPMRGVVEDQPGSEVSLTFHDDFIYGYIRLGMQLYYIEPLYHFIKGGEKGKYVLYSVRDIKPGPERKCGYNDDRRELDRIQKQTTQGLSQQMPGGCFEVQINAAADFTMFSFYGLTGTQNHNIGVLNNVQTNYDNEFADDLQLQMGEQWISSCSTCDPWTSSLDPGDLLDDFTSWALNGFSVGHDIASCWTRRDFTGGTIGLAWVGVVCSQYKYHVLQDFSSNAELKRVLMAHEMGHNFDASHNTGIMAPSVSTATNWSSTSIAEIQAHYLSVGCLSNCSSGTAPTPDFTFVQVNPCEPASMEYTALAPNANTWEWTFAGGNPAVSTLQNPVVEYATTGVYNVTLEVSNGYGSNSSTVPVYVSVIPNAVANFQYAVNNHVVTFTFTGVSANTFQWDFGDGTPPATVANPTHTYPINGTYNVTLEVTNACGSNTITIPVTISVLPFVNFSAVPISGCQPLTVGFTNLSTNAVSYNWSFPGGSPSTSTAANPTVVFNTPGFHTVTLEATNSAGTNTIVKNDYISADPLPVGGFTSSSNANTVTFTQQTNHADTILWNFGDGQTSNLWNPVHTYTTNDTFTVTQVLTNGCGTIQYNQQLIIAVPPQPSFTPSGPDTLCIAQGVQFVSTTTNNPQTYAWTFEGGSPATSADSMPYVVYQTPGLYDVTLVVTNQFGSSLVTISDQISVNSIPSVAFTYDVSGLEASFVSQVTNGDSLFWQFGDGQGTTGSQTVHTYTGEGTYTVSLKAENTCGDSMSVQQVPVYYFPAGGIQITEDTVCFAQDIQFQGQSASNTNQWSWSFPGGNPTSSSQQAPLVNYANPGQYTATLIVTNAVGSDTVEQSVSILEGALASADLLQNGFSVQCTFTGVNQDSVLWAFGDGVISSILNPSHTYASPGTYLITLVAFHECGNDTIVRQVTFLPSSLDDTGEFSDVKIVPNPTSGVFLLHTEQAMLKEVTIEVRDLLGRRIELLTNAPLSAASPCLIDISVAEAGVYTIIVRSGDKSRAWLLVKTDR